MTFTGPLINNRIAFTQSFENRFVRTPVNSLPLSGTRTFRATSPSDMSCAQFRNEFSGQRARTISPKSLLHHGSVIDCYLLAVPLEPNNREFITVSPSDHYPSRSLWLSFSPA